MALTPTLTLTLSNPYPNPNPITSSTFKGKPHREHSSNPNHQNPKVSANKSLEILGKVLYVFMCAFALEKKRTTIANIPLPKLSLSLQTGHRTSLRHEMEHIL